MPITAAGTRRAIPLAPVTGTELAATSGHRREVFFTDTLRRDRAAAHDRRQPLDAWEQPAAGRYADVSASGNTTPEAVGSDRHVSAFATSGFKEHATKVRTENSQSGMHRGTVGSGDTSVLKSDRQRIQVEVHLQQPQASATGQPLKWGTVSRCRGRNILPLPRASSSRRNLPQRLRAANRSDGAAGR